LSRWGICREEGLQELPWGTPCLLAVCTRLGRMLWVLSPLSDRVPRQILRKITRCRRDCSAWLLVGGTPGRRRKVKRNFCSGPARKVRRVSAGLKRSGCWQIWFNSAMERFSILAAAFQESWPDWSFCPTLQSREPRSRRRSQKEPVAGSFSGEGDALKLFNFQREGLWHLVRPQENREKENSIRRPDTPFLTGARQSPLETRNLVNLVNNEVIYPAFLSPRFPFLPTPRIDLDLFN